MRGRDLRGDMRFAYPVTNSGDIVMPPMESAFPGTVAALPLSVSPPPGLRFDPKPGRLETRGLLSLGRPFAGPMAAERVEYPDDVPFDRDERELEEFSKTNRAIADVERGILEDDQAKRNLDQQIARFQQSALEVDGASRAALLNQRTGVPVGVSSPVSAQRAVAAVRGPVPEGTEGLLPIFEPMHNAREIAKQLVLLEDHLAHPSKHCPDCIRKHLLTAEALAEEAVSLDEGGQNREYFQKASREIRDISRSFIEKKDRGDLQQRVRVLRKSMSKSGFSALDKSSARRASLVASPGISPVQETPRRTVPSDIEVYMDEYVSSPFRGSRASVAGVIPRARVAYRVGSSSSYPWVPGLVLGAGQTYPYLNRVVSSVAPSSDRVDIEGIAIDSYGRRNEPGLTMPISGVSAVAQDVIPLSVTPVSNHLVNQKIIKYKHTGEPMEPFSLTGAQLFQADLIQAVMERALGSGQEICQKAGITNPQQLEGNGCLKRIAEQFARMAIVTALYESTLNPSASNRKGKDDSWGLYQMNRLGGMGSGHEPRDLVDPVYSTTLLATNILKSLSHFKPLIVQEASFQPTRVGEWVDIWTRVRHRPANPEAQGMLRARTADSLFPTWGAQYLTMSAVIKAGADLNVDAFAQQHPVVWKTMEPVEQSIAGLSARKGSPGELTAAEAQALRAAAEAWEQAGVATSDPQAFLRATFLYRYASDMEGYGRMLEQVSTLLAGTALGTEAARMLDELRQTVPRKGLLFEDDGTLKKVAIYGGSVIAVGLLLMSVSRAARSVRY